MINNVSYMFKSFSLLILLLRNSLLLVDPVPKKCDKPIGQNRAMIIGTHHHTY